MLRFIWFTCGVCFITGTLNIVRTGRSRSLFSQAFFHYRSYNREPRLLVTRNSYANRRASRLRSGRVTTAERGRRTKGLEQTCRPADNATEEKTGQSLRSVALFIYTWRYCSCTLSSTAPTRPPERVYLRCVI